MASSSLIENALAHPAQDLGGFENLGWDRGTVMVEACPTVPTMPFEKRLLPRPVDKVHRPFVHTGAIRRPVIDCRSFQERVLSHRDRPGPSLAMAYPCHGNPSTRRKPLPHLYHRFLELSPPVTSPYMNQVSDTRVLETQTLVPPCELTAQIPGSSAAYAAVIAARRAIQDVLQGRDARPIVVVGPCSIHDPEGAMEYARRLKPLAARLNDRMLIVMRVYFEKPRTTTGWKGLINDPDLNGSFNMAKGLRLARRLLLDINELGVPTATEMLEPLTPQYIGDLVAWAAIGARTTESQTHRQMASGLSAPVGFKNTTGGNLQVAIDAMRSAASGHNFLGINHRGEVAMVTTAGNPDTHLILRGGDDATNFSQDDVASAAARLAGAGLEPRLMVDCSHANSGKKHANQAHVWRDLIDQIRRGRDQGAPQTPISAVIGMMLESNLEEGRQGIPEDLSKLQYGVSVTDECMGWNMTESLLSEGYEQLG